MNRSEQLGQTLQQAKCALQNLAQLFTTIQCKGCDGIKQRKQTNLKVSGLSSGKAPRLRTDALESCVPGQRRQTTHTGKQRSKTKQGGCVMLAAKTSENNKILWVLQLRYKESERLVAAK